MPAILIGMLVYGVVHSLLAGRRVKQTFRAWLGDRAYYGLYRLCYNIFAAVTFMPIAFALLLLPSRQVWTLEGVAAAAGILVQVVGLVLFVMALAQIDLGRFLGLSQLGAYLASEPLPLPPEAMQTGGLYGLVRHPLYLASILVLWSQLQMTEFMLAFNIAATLYFAIGSWYEEKRLLAAFGDEYASYQKRVPWLLPVRLHRNLDS